MKSSSKRMETDKRRYKTETEVPHHLVINREELSRRQEQCHEVGRSLRCDATEDEEQKL